MDSDLRRKAYRSWSLMRLRAVDVRMTRRANHSVCAAWLSQADGFEAFLDAVGLPPSEAHFLSRRDRRLPWGPDNAFWTQDEARRHRPVEQLISAFGARLSYHDWSKVTGVPKQTIRRRFFYFSGRMTAEQILLLPRHILRHRRAADAALVNDVALHLSRGKETP